MRRFLRFVIRGTQHTSREVRAAAHVQPSPSANVPVPDLRAKLKHGIEGLRVGVPRANWFNENKGTDSETESIFNDALKVFGRPRCYCL